MRRREPILSEIKDFLLMGGYALYVWSAFGFALVVLLAVLVQSLWAARRREEELAQLRALTRPAAARRGAPRPPRLTPQPDEGHSRHQV